MKKDYSKIFKISFDKNFIHQLLIDEAKFDRFGVCEKVFYRIRDSEFAFRNEFFWNYEKDLKKKIIEIYEELFKNQLWTDGTDL